MIDLKSMTQEEMRSFFQEMGQPKFRAKQVFQWLHRGASGFQEMSNIPKTLQQQLALQRARERTALKAVRNNAENTLR